MKSAQLQQWNPRQVAWMSLRGLDPRLAGRHPVLLALELGAMGAALLSVLELIRGTYSLAAFMAQIAVLLLLALLAISFGVAAVEAKSLGRARRLRALQSDIQARSLVLPHDPNFDGLFETVASGSLTIYDVVLVKAGDLIPTDGEVIDGVAEVDESAVTGESAPVIRESGDDRSAVIGGTRVLSDWLKIKVTAPVGSSIYDQVVRLIEAARRRTSGLELLSTTPLLAMAILITLAAIIFRPFPEGAAGLEFVILLLALFAALLPTATAGFLAAAGIADIDRLVTANLVAKSRAAVEAAGLVDTLLLDKTGTITLGGRTAEEFLPLHGIDERDLVEAAYLASQRDDTPEGRSISRYGEQKYGLVPKPDRILSFVPFNAQSRMSGAVLADGLDVHKGAPDAILRHLQLAATDELKGLIERIGQSGGTPLAVSRGGAIIGVVHLKDTVRPGMRDQCIELRHMGVRTLMVTGDNARTAATVAAAAGVDDFVAEATPQAKLQLILDQQALGKRVAMCGDGTNDAPALAQADLGIALNSGSAAAREAGNMLDLESDPLKLIEVIRVGRELLIPRRSLLGFALATDFSKIVVITLAIFAVTFPSLVPLTILKPMSSLVTLLAGNLFNVVIIIAIMLLTFSIIRPAGVKDLHLRRQHRAAFRDMLAAGIIGRPWRHRTITPVYVLVGLATAPVVIALLQPALAALGLVN